jgi:hypothetical protein
MAEDPAERRRRVMRCCDRILSGQRPLTVRERLADLSAAGVAEAGTAVLDLAAAAAG